MSTLAVVLAMAALALWATPGCNPSPGEPLVTPVPIPTPTLPPQEFLSVRISNAEGQIGDVVQAEVLAAGAIDGISGFRVVVKVEDGTVAQVVDIDLDAIGFALVGDLPATSVEVVVVDLTGKLKGPLEAALLATIHVELLSEGFTVLTVEILQVDSAKGDILLPWVYPGTITVTGAVP